MKPVSLEAWDNNQTVVTTQQIPTHSGHFDSMRVVLSLIRSSFILLALPSGKEVNKHFQMFIKCLLNV